MAPALNRPQGHLTPSEALQLAQQAPAILKSNPKALSTSPLSFLFSSTETAELWTIYENLLKSCLRTGDDDAAHSCLERLIIRFGDDNERVMAFKGLVREAQASNDAELQAVLKDYEVVVKENTSNVAITKRKIALLRSMGKTADAISALNGLLSFSPTDAEAWAELADIYLSQGLFSQAIFSLEEVLVLSPNAWNMHARLGEVLFMAAKEGSDGSLTGKYLAEALKRYCRSIDLCDDYLRGFYGLKLVTNELLSENGGSKSKKQTDSDDFAAPDQATIEKLNQVATAKLGEITRRYGAGERLWQGYQAAEIDAAKDLLAQSTSTTVR